MATVTNGTFYSSLSYYGSYSNYYQVDWAASSNNGKYTISVKVQLVGDIGSYWRECKSTTLTIEAVSGCTVTPASRATGVNQEIIINNYLPNNESKVSDATVYTFTVTQSGNTNLTIKLGINGTIGSTLVTGNGTYELAVLTTACTAPGSVSASGIIALGSSATVEWTAGGPGTNNDVSGYTIFWKIGEKPTLSNYDGTASAAATATSKAVTIPSSVARGSTVYFGVRTKGTAGSSYYSPIKTGGSVKINSLPTRPTFNGYVSKSGTTDMVTVTASTGKIVPGTDSDSGQNISVWYASSASGIKIKITSNLNDGISLGPSGTWYFWTFDGLEYSSETATFVVTQDSVPKNFAITTQSPETYAANNGTYTKVAKFTVSATNLKPNVNNTLYTRVYYTTDGNTTPTTSSDYQELTSNVAADSSGEATSISKQISQNWAKLKGLSLGANVIKFRYRCRIYNGTSYSAWTSLSETTYEYARAPITSSAIPLKNNGDTFSSNPTVFSKKIRLPFIKDESLTSISVSATANGAPITNPTIDSTVIPSGSYNAYINITLPNNITNDSSVVVTATLSNSYLSCQIQWTGITIVSAPSMKNLSYSITSFKPFTTTEIASVTMTWPFGSSETIDNKYAIDETSDYLKLCYKNGSNEVKKAFSATKELTLLEGQVNCSDIYDWNHALGITTYRGTYNITAYAEITNRFGDTYVSNNISLVLNFNEPVNTVTWTDNKDIEYSTISTGTYASSVSKHLYEGLYLKFYFNISAYTRTTYTYILQEKVGNNTSWVEVTRGTVTTGSTTNKNAISKPIELVYGPLPEVTDSIRGWRIVAFNSVDSTNKNNTSKTTDMLRHTLPTIVIKNLEYDSSQFTLDYSLSDYGYDTSATEAGTFYIVDETPTVYSAGFTLEKGTDKEEIISDTQGSSGTWEVKSFTIKAVTSVTSDITSSTISKTFYLPYVIVYQILPTVSYRKNYLGVNTKTPESDAVVEIHTTQGRDSVYIINATNNTIMAVISASGGVLGGGSTVI